MEKFIKFGQKYNLKELGLIFVFSFLLFVIFYGKQDAYLVDVGREAYIPWQILEGKVLYKDIFNVYGPLGYQINAIAYLIFGTSLNTLYLMGFFNSLLISFVTFFSAKLFVDKKTALCITALTMSVCIYIRTFFNFIFAYSYSALYALSGFLLSLFSMLLFIKEKKRKYLWVAFLCAGFSLANKIEYLPYFCLLFLSLPFVLTEKKDWKNYFKAFLAFSIFPVSSFGVLLLQGAGFGDFLDAFVLIKKLMNVPATEYFYNAYGLYFNPLHAKLSFYYLGKLLSIALPCAVLFYGLNFPGEKYIKNKALKTFLNIAVFFGMCTAVVKFMPQFLPMSEGHFCWLGLSGALCALVFGLWFLYKLIKNKFDFSLIKAKDKMFFFMLLSALCVSIKGISGITTECYGTFSLAALFLPFVILFVVYLPRIFKSIDKEVLGKTVVNLCFIVVFSYLFANTFRLVQNPLYPVKTERGKIFVREVFKSQNEFIKYISKTTPKDAVVVSTPEGAIINFLAQRKSHNLYYYLIPVNVQVFGEDKILFDFKKNPPDYFIMNNVPYSPFNVGDFCDYANNICNFIESAYEPAVEVDDGVRFVLYKKKK